MEAREIYKAWLSDPYFDEETKRELEALAKEEKEIEDRFGRELEFGTGGLRGIMGAGTNRMNSYMVRKATQGLANYMIKQKTEKKEWLSPLIPETTPPVLHKRRRCVSVPMGFGYLFSRRFVLLPCSLLQCGI